jgi:hypothetical protein
MVTESEMVTEGDLGLRGTAARRTRTAPGADGRARPALFLPDGTLAAGTPGRAGE